MKILAVIGVTVMVLGAISGMAHGTSMVNKIDPKEDSDHDSLTNGQEYLWGTDPNDPDSDGDGCYDGWEIWYENHRAVHENGTPIIDPNYHFDANFGGNGGIVVDRINLIQVRDADTNVLINDPDKDGWNNLHEFLVGTDPTDPDTNDDDQYWIDSVDPCPLCLYHQPLPGNLSDDGNQPCGNGGGGSGVGQVIKIL